MQLFTLAAWFKFKVVYNTQFDTKYIYVTALGSVLNVNINLLYNAASERVSCPILQHLLCKNQFRIEAKLVWQLKYP